MHGIDAPDKAIEGDGTSLNGGLDYAHALEVVDADGRTVFCTVGIEPVALQTEVHLLRLVQAQVLNTGIEPEDIKQALVGIDLALSEAERRLLRKLVCVTTVSDDILDVGIGQGLVLILGSLHPERHDTSDDRRRHRGARRKVVTIVAGRFLALELIGECCFDVVVRIVETVGGRQHVVARSRHVRIGPLLAAEVVAETAEVAEISHGDDFLVQLIGFRVYTLVVGYPCPDDDGLSRGGPVTHAAVVGADFIERGVIHGVGKQIGLIVAPGSHRHIFRRGDVDGKQVSGLQVLVQFGTDFYSVEGYL